MTIRIGDNEYCLDGYMTEIQKLIFDAYHQGLADGIGKGRADAIEQILEQMTAYRDAHYYSFSNYDVQRYADGFKNATNTLISMVEELKENKNE